MSLSRKAIRKQKSDQAYDRHQPAYRPEEPHAATSQHSVLYGVPVLRHLDVHFIYTLPVPVASRHSRAACPVPVSSTGQDLIRERESRRGMPGDWMPAVACPRLRSGAGMTFSWCWTDETDIWLSRGPEIFPICRKRRCPFSISAYAPADITLLHLLEPAGYTPQRRRETTERVDKVQA